MIVTPLLLTVMLQAPPSTVDPAEAAQKLLQVKRVHIEPLTGENANQVRDMLIAALHRSRLFVLTENAATADAVIRGSAEDLIYTDVFQSSEGVTARVNSGIARGSSSSRNRESLALGASIGEQESSRIQERKHEASASIRMVGRDGDVLWSASMESQGAKFRSAAADVADRLTRQLTQDLEKLRGTAPVSLGAPKAPAVSTPAPPGS
jgi:hypothetical protein